MRRGSATMSNINFIMVGEEEDSGIRLMSGKDHTVNIYVCQHNAKCNEYDSSYNNKYSRAVYRQYKGIFVIQCIEWITYHN